MDAVGSPARVGQSSPVRSVDAGDQSLFLSPDQITSMDAVGSPARFSRGDTAVSEERSFQVRGDCFSSWRWAH
ncbi:hypothetical protein SLA2020_450760 [Shorea laevis]